ncbi:MAG: NAD(P)H-dependent oxidoreductase subunit E [Phycisphaerae bacterium]|nr:NAD(P)H-dependent oxidoreductase subunit E [Phycisphaerae bacterium]
MKTFDMQTYQNLIKDVGGLTVENLFVFLCKVQETFGCVPNEVVRDVAMKTGFSEARIYGALTSYREFKVGRECGD